MQQMEARQVCACNTPVLVGACKQQILSTHILRKQLARNNFPWNAAWEVQPFVSLIKRELLFMDRYQLSENTDFTINASSICPPNWRLTSYQ